jgi:hypothetical protein
MHLFCYGVLLLVLFCTWLKVSVNDELFLELCFFHSTFHFMSKIIVIIIVMSYIQDNNENTYGTLLDNFDELTFPLHENVI